MYSIVSKQHTGILSQYSLISDLTTHTLAVTHNACIKSIEHTT